jgi:hypothetical protein
VASSLMGSAAEAGRGMGVLTSAAILLGCSEMLRCGLAVGGPLVGVPALPVVLVEGGWNAEPEVLSGSATRYLSPAPAGAGAVAGACAFGPELTVCM